MIEINKIYNEDCLDTMSRMPDNFIDLTVTSPPYDNLRTYNDNIDESWGEHIWKPIIKDLFRVTKEGGVVVWVVGDATIDGSETGTSFRQALFFMGCGFNLHDTMIYAKNAVGACGSPNGYNQSFEYMFIFTKGKISKFNPIKDLKAKKGGSKTTYALTKSNKNGYLSNTTIKKAPESSKRQNIWFYDIGFGDSSDKIASKHPAIFPEKLAYDHILSWSNEGDLIYDPFMGSGTTARASICANRNWIGSEISKEYCDIIDKRLDPLLNNLFTNYK